MRTKIIAVATAAAVTFSAVPAITPAALAAEPANQTSSSEQVKNGLDRAFSKEAWTPKEEGAKGFFEWAFEPYKLIFNPDNDRGRVEQSAEGSSRNVINYIVIAAIITVVGQIIQLAMAAFRG
ncbi:hypothetical protein [Corynebacterium aquatimens]|uniref:Secreted protein n=1 Tax=Corynebacterium aquatimens TaxID=1190508 RepID=A0A931GRX8_9CORY|nr:hypothetical protein [Corynebacterium aquatimens]MBG6121467.1 hypothetical protein [Corynebacterium aquatimens]WJY65989.1 hypothetical protein CAQUA_06425 [Corynebacterium aquatimens]